VPSCWMPLPPLTLKRLPHGDDAGESTPALTSGAHVEWISCR
jgi:hypothetical protein